MKSIIYIYNDVMLEWRLLLKAPKLQLDLSEKCFKDDLQKIVNHIDWTKENIFNNINFSKVKFLPDTDFSKSVFNNCIMSSDDSLVKIETNEQDKKERNNAINYNSSESFQERLDYWKNKNWDASYKEFDW